MRKYHFFYLFFIAFLLFACQSEKGNFLPELNVNTPDILADNEEVVVFVKVNEEMLNDYSNTFEKIVIACSTLVIKEESELLSEEKELLGGYMMDLTENLGMFAVKIAEMEATYTAVEYALSEEQLPAFNEVMLLFTQRVLTINERYANFGIPQDQIEN